MDGRLPIFNSGDFLATDTNELPLSVPDKTRIERAQREIEVRKEAAEKKDKRFAEVVSEVERLFRAIDYTAKHVAKQRAYCLGEDVELPEIPKEWIAPPRGTDE